MPEKKASLSSAMESGVGLEEEEEVEEEEEAGKKQHQQGREGGDG